MTVYDPTNDPRYLGGDDEQEGPDIQEQVAELRANLDANRLIRELFQQEGWEHVKQAVSKDRVSALRTIANRQTEWEDVLFHRGRIAVFDWLLLLPDRIDAEMEAWNQELDALENPADE